MVYTSAVGSLQANASLFKATSTPIQQTDNYQTIPMVQVKDTKKPAPTPQPFDMEAYKAEKLKIARANYEKDLVSKKLIYVPEQKIFGIGSPAHYIYNIDKDGERYGDIKYHYNLPDGVFKKYVEELGGNRDLYKAYGTVEIPADILEAAVGYGQK